MPRPLSGPSHAAAQRSALRWTSRDSRSPSAGRVARANSISASARDRRARKRLGPDDVAGRWLDQRLEQNVDLLVRDDALEHQVTRGGGGAGVAPCPKPAAPLY